MSIRMRPIEAVDSAFLFELYRSTRMKDMASWGWRQAEIDTFLHMQYQAQKKHYFTEFADAEHRIINCQDVDVGQIVVARSDEEIRLVDICVLSGQRNRGIGRKVIESLLNEAESSNKPVRLSVEKSSPATRLYQRLGFNLTGDTGVHYTMEWLPIKQKRMPDVRLCV